MLLISSVVILVGVVAYAGYGDKIQDIVTLNLPHNNVTMAARVLYSFGLLGSYPLQMLPALEIQEKTSMFLSLPNFSKYPRVILTFLTFLVQKHLFPHLSSLRDRYMLHHSPKIRPLPKPFRRLQHDLPRLHHARDHVRPCLLGAGRAVAEAGALRHDRLWGCVRGHECLVLGCGAAQSCVERMNVH